MSKNDSSPVVSPGSCTPLPLSPVTYLQPEHIFFSTTHNSIYMQTYIRQTTWVGIEPLTHGITSDRLTIIAI